MDGTGALFEPFIRLLPGDVDVRVARYPEDTYLTYEQLAERVATLIPVGSDYLIVAESYSGPVAALLAAHPVGNLRAVVLVASFVSLPLGRVGKWIAMVVPTAVFRLRLPAWFLRWLLMDSPDMVSAVQSAIARVKPAVLAQRFRDALAADYASVLATCAVRIVQLRPTADRLLGTRSHRGFGEVVSVTGPHLLLQCAPEASLAALRELGLLGNRVSYRYSG
jgi:hypothetical protein